MTTTPIDPTKIRPGDTVTFHEAEVLHVGPIALGIRWPSGERDGILRGGVASVKRKTREFQPGDRVTWGRGATIWTIEVIRSEMACLVLGHFGITLQPLLNLRHADEGESNDAR